jgi:alpha-ketoglutarate-dependent 2,4-dichlorophenoxyacetate dioxygenase
MTWRNPVNGRVARYIASHAYTIDGFSDAEAWVLLDELIAGATWPECTYQHHWQQGDVLMWDNRATMHRGRPWQHDERRSMIRTTTSPSKPMDLSNFGETSRQQHRMCYRTL